MMEVHYGVVKADGKWTIIGQGLRTGHFETPSEAQRVARRMADHASGLPVHLHFQDETGGFQSERWGEAA